MGAHTHTAKYVAVALAASLAIGSLTAGGMSAAASEPASGTIQNQQRWAPEKFRSYGITYREFCEQNGEPDAGHLMIGTYLINLVPEEKDDGTVSEEPTITGEIYQAAMISRKTYQQEVSFYKSELAGGEWRDIDIAESISYILPTGGVAVSDAEMDEMLITVYVSGGNAEPTVTEGDDSDENPFLNPSPYNLDDMSPMSQLLLMTTDGSLTYTTERIDDHRIAENQSKRFMYDRLNYMFLHDEVTDTLPITDGDDERALPAEVALRETAGSDKSKAVESLYDEIEELGELDLLLVNRASDGNYYTDGQNGSVASAGRQLYHFSDTRDEVTEPLDAAVVNLWEVYLVYKKSTDTEGAIKDEDKAGFVYDLCAEADMTRRAEAYYNLAVNEDFHGGTGSVLSQIRDMSTDGTSLIGRNIANMEYYTPLRNKATLRGTEEIGGYVSDAALVAAVNQAIKDATDMYSDYSAYTSTRGTTAVSMLIYDNKQTLFGATGKNDEVDALITETMLAEAIDEDSSRDDNLEAALLTSKLIPSQNGIFGGYLEQGLPERYNEVGMTSTQQGALLASQQTTAYNSESAMEKLIKAYVSRMQDKEALENVLQEQMIWVKAEKSRLSSTDYGRYAEEVRQKYEDFLNKTMKELGFDISEDEGDPIYDELQKRKKQAIEDDDPKAEKEINAILDKYEKTQPDPPDGYTPIITIDPDTNIPRVDYVPDGSTTDANAGAGLGDGSGNGSGSGLAGSGDGDNLGGSASTGTIPTSATDLLAALEALIGMSFDDMGPDGKIELIAALNQYGRENGNDIALELARTLLEQVMEERNPFVYSKYRGSMDMEYVSLAAVDRARLYTRFRLVREDLDITMSRIDAGLAYIYRYGSPTLTDMDGREEDLVAKLASQSDTYMNRGSDERFPYLDEEDAQIRLSCRAEYMEDSAYSLVITSTMEPKIKEYIKLLTDIFNRKSE